MLSSPSALQASLQQFAEAEGTSCTLPDAGGRKVKTLRRLADALMGLKGVRNENDMALGHWRPGEDGPRRQQALSLLVAVGEMALGHGLEDLARLCGGHAASASSASAANARAVFLQARLTLASQTTPQTTFTKAAVNLRLQTLNEVQIALSAAKQCNDRRLVQQGCLLLWNCALPLLQPNLRKAAKRSLTVAADTLASLDSNLYDVRCSLHIELAKIAADASLFTLVAAHVKRGRLVDRHNMHAEELRELEAQLAACDAASGVGFDGPLQRANRLVAQAVEAADASVCRIALAQAGAHLLPALFDTDNLPAVPPASNTRERASPMARSARASRFRLVSAVAAGHDPSGEVADVWAKIAHAARQEGLWDIGAAAALLALRAPTFRPSSAAPVLPVPPRAGSGRSTASVRNATAAAAAAHAHYMIWLEGFDRCVGVWGVGLPCLQLSWSDC